ncbi:MAG TPA: cupin domain-containing protein [Polyangia bacterium]
MMRLHIICGALLLGHGALAQRPASQPGPAGARPSGAGPAGGPQTTLKYRVPPLPPSTDDSLTAQLADARWTPAEKLDPKMPPGAQVALIGADPVSTGPTVYVRTKPGYKMPAHWHTHLETSIMVAGKGTHVVAGRKIPSSPGTFVIVPSKAPHEFTCDAGAECIFVVRRSGPTDFNLVGK